MIATATRKQTSFPDSLFHFPSWVIKAEAAAASTLIVQIFFSDMEKQPHVGGEIVIKLQQK